MKVYVDELPKSCAECDLFEQNETGSCWCCVSGDSCPSRNVPKLYKSCSLQSLTDYTKQVRKEVLDIIDQKFNCCGYVEEKFEDIKKYVLEQTQGE
jgi:hypothetical protein